VPSPPELRPVAPGAPRLAPDLEFPAYRFVSGLHPHPVRDPGGHSHGAPAPEPRAVDPARWGACADYLAGIDLFNAGFLWEAHERWEGLWKASSDPLQRELLQGLVQLAAALIKVHLEERRGARGLAQAALERLRRVRDAAAGERSMGLDCGALVAAVEGCFDPVLRGAPWSRDSIWPRAPALLPR